MPCTEAYKEHIMLTFNGTEEKTIEKAIAAFAHIIPLEAMPPPHFPALIFRDWKSDYTNAEY